MIQVGRVDADFGSLAAVDVGEGRAVEDRVVEPVAEILAGVEPAAEDAAQIPRAVRRQAQPALEVGEQHFTAEARETLPAIDAVVRRGKRAAGNAADHRHIVEQVAVGGFHLGESGEHPVREGRRAQTASRERKHDRVLVHEVLSRAHVGRRRPGERLVRRRVEHRRGAGGEHEQQKDAPHEASIAARSDDGAQAHPKAGVALEHFEA